LKAGVARAGVTLEKLLVTHGHMDHCGLAGVLAEELGLPLEGPHEDDRFWIEGLDDPNTRMGLEGKSFEPTRWLQDGDTVTVGELTLDVIHCPGHTPGHVVFFHAPSRLAIGGCDLSGLDRADRFSQGQPSAVARFDHRKIVAAGQGCEFYPRPWSDEQLWP
jgi:glyoxylase-like metal-dependent hydrolase (beta-lactamase superfamily II)